MQQRFLHRTAFLIGLFFSLGCQQNVQSKKFQSPELSLSPIEESVDDFQFTSPKTQTPTDQLLAISEKLSNKLPDGESEFLKFYSESNILESITFEESPYMQALIKKAQPEFEKGVENIIKVVGDEKTNILTWLSNVEYKWPEKIASAASVPDVVSNYLDFVLAQAPIKDKRVLQGFSQEVAAAKVGEIAEFKKSLIDIESEKDLGLIITKIERLLSKLKQEIPSDLKKAKNIQQKILETEGPQSALRLLIAVWESLPEKTRVQSFPNKKLAEFLDGKSQRDLNCLKSACADPYLWLARKMFILPEIEDFGVGNVRKQVRLGVIERIKDQVKVQSLDFLKKFPQELGRRIQVGVDAKLTEVKSMSDNLSAFLKPKAKDWAVKNGLSTIKLIKGNDRVVVAAYLKVLSAFVQNSGTVFSGDKKEQNALRLIEIMNQLLLESHFLNEATVYSLIVPGPKNFILKDEALMLSALSSLIPLFKDWESTVFDSLLSEMTLTDWDTQLPSEKIFPKAAFSALIIGESSKILLNLSPNLSPVFVVNENNEMVWADNFDFDNDTASMAAIVNIFNGIRQTLVKSQDLSQFLLSLVEFLQNIEGVEKTSNPYLTENSGDGRGIDKLLSAKKKLRFLAIGATNFISHEMMAKDGGVWMAYENGEVVTTEIRTLESQKTVFALLKKMNEWTGVEIYKDFALKIKSFVNRNK